MIRFYAPDVESTGELPEVESGHCCRVLRMKTGDAIYVVDGKGSVFNCVITDPHPKHTGVEIISKSEEPVHWKGNITLAVAPTKNIDRIEWLFEKAVEMGVNELVLLKCARSERKNVNNERLEKILVSAMKQSLKATLPVFTGMMDFKEFISRAREGMRFVGYCDDRTERRDFSKEFPGNRDVTVMIGPEGDFSPEEIKAAFEAGFQPVTFGNSRLRTETAALFALAAIHVLDMEHS